MARYNSLNVAYDPLSFDEILKPLQIAQERYDAQRQRLDNFALQTNKWNQFLDPVKDEQSYREFEEYKNQIDQAASILVSEGKVSPSNRALFESLPGGYSEKIMPIEAAWTAKNNEIDAQNEGRSKGLVYENDARYMSVDDFKPNLQAGKSNFYDENKVIAQSSNLFTQLQREIQGSTSFNDILGGQFFQQILNSGFRAKEIQNAAANKDLSSILSIAKEYVIDSSGINQWKGVLDENGEYTEYGLQRRKELEDKINPTMYNAIGELKTKELGNGLFGNSGGSLNKQYGPYTPQSYNNYFTGASEAGDKETTNLYSKSIINPDGSVGVERVEDVEIKSKIEKILEKLGNPTEKEVYERFEYMNRKKEIESDKKLTRDQKNDKLMELYKEYDDLFANDKYSDVNRAANNINKTQVLYNNLYDLFEYRTNPDSFSEKTTLIVDNMINAPELVNNVDGNQYIQAKAEALNLLIAFNQQSNVIQKLGYSSPFLRDDKDTQTDIIQRLLNTNVIKTNNGNNIDESTFVQVKSDGSEEQVSSSQYEKILESVSYTDLVFEYGPKSEETGIFIKHKGDTYKIKNNATMNMHSEDIHNVIDVATDFESALTYSDRITRVSQADYINILADNSPSSEAMKSLIINPILSSSEQKYSIITIVGEKPNQVANVVLGPDRRVMFVLEITDTSQSAISKYLHNYADSLFRNLIPEVSGNVTQRRPDEIKM